MNTPNPARQMTLVGKALTSGDFPQAGSLFADQLDRTL
jgi:hypothetical protein